MGAEEEEWTICISEDSPGVRTWVLRILPCPGTKIKVAGLDWDSRGLNFEVDSIQGYANQVADASSCVVKNFW